MPKPDQTKTGETSETRSSETSDFISRMEAILERSLTQAELDEICVRENFRAALQGRPVEESSQNLTFPLDKEDELS